MNVTNLTNIVTQPPPLPPSGSSLARKVISSFAISVLIVLTLFGNALVIAAFYRYRRVRSSVTNWFILSLAICDLLVASLSEPFWLSIEITEWKNFPVDFNYDVFVKFWTMLDITCAVSSTVNLMFIAIDRYFAIKSPLLHHTKMGPETAKWIIPLLWGYALLASCIVLTEWSWMVLTLFIIGFLFPLLVMIFCYGGILHVVVSKGSGSRTGRVGRRMSREFKTAKSLGVVTGAFVVCWLPFHIVSLAYQYCPRCHAQIENLRAVPSAVKWLHYLNSCLNPIIYAFLNPTFKLAFKNLFKLCIKRQQDNFDTESSFSLSFRRRGTKTSTASFRKKRFEEEKPNGQIPNGNASPLSPWRRPSKSSLMTFFGKKTRRNTNDSSSSEEGIAAKKGPDVDSVEVLRDTCFIMEGKDVSEPLLGSDNSNAGSEDKSPIPLNSPKEDDPDRATWPSPQRYTVPKRSVSFTDHEEFLRNGSCVTAKDDGLVDSPPLFERQLSTVLDQEKNQYYFIVDGVMIPDEEIKCTDV